MINFNGKYRNNEFIDFLCSFLPEDFKESEKDIIIKKERYKEISKAKILGYSSSLDAYVLEMDHTRENDPRIAIATDAFKILADNWIHRALVIFKNKASENYRLSYLTISLDLNDKNKAVKRYSNARRYSFYLGENAKIRTPEQQLIKKGRVKDAEDLLNRFSVEVVNKQFYLEIAKFFDELVSGEDKNLALPGVSEEDINTRKSFAVRLIGRIMFCWFLKQKKSENGQLIPDELLSSKAVLNNYYHNTLEPLFFGVLNTNIESRDIRSDLFDKVPYLNGGLFNPQSDDYYELDRGTFTSKHINTLKISDSWFKDFFELLETYNFTIDENTVFDQELSVDPEMLGRIFENLLAEINPETGSSERKRTGSFYTPRQIVEYMVDQSLIEYLKTKTKIDEKKLAALVSYDLTDDTEHPLTDKDKQEIINAIESLKILDPACGSGAYPIGALQKIVYILQQIDPDCKMWLEQKLKNVPELYKKKIIDEVKSNPFDYTRKLDVIKNSIFGVDIQPIAVDVSRLRCFLTLVVESEINDSRQNRGIEPLPNLDFKFVCANTLIGLPKLEINSLFEDHSGIKELSEIMSEYFTANRSEKESIKTRFFNKQKDLLNRMLGLKATGELTLKLTLWNPFSNTSSSWFDPEWMFGLGEKFDVVIGNPPYIEFKKLKDKSLYSHYNSAHGKYDIYVLFIEFAEKVLKENGNLVFIIPTTFLKKDYGYSIRQHIVNNLIIRKILDFSDIQMFDSAINYTGVFVFQKQTPSDYSFKYHKYKNSSINTTSAHIFGNLSTEISDTQKEIITVNSKELDSKSWNFQNDVFQSFLNRISLKSSPLSEYTNEIFQGIASGKDEVFYVKEIDINAYQLEKDLLKPIVKGKDLKAYKINWSGFYVIYPYNNNSKVINEKELQSKYPNIYNYFLSKKELLSSRDYFKNSSKLWYELWNQRQYANFDCLRIIVPEISGNNNFVLTDSYFGNTKTYHLILKDREIKNYKYFLGVLNSSLINYIYKHMTTPQAGGFYAYKTQFLKNIPIRVTPEVKEKITTAVEFLENESDEEEIKKNKFKINELVMDLYELNEKEKEIIRNS